MAEPLSCCCYLLALITFLLATRIRLERESSSLGYIVSSIIFHILVSAFVIIGFLIKETTITATAAILSSAVLISLQTCLNDTDKKSVGPRLISVLRRFGTWIALSLILLALYVSLRLILTTDMNPLGVLFSQGLKPLFGQLSHFMTRPQQRKAIFLEQSELIRKAENPFAFLHGQEYVLSMMYLHFRYLYLLLWPDPLCAEYSFDCIPKVSSTVDVRNLYSLASYLTLLSFLCTGLWEVMSNIRLMKTSESTFSSCRNSSNESADDVPMVILPPDSVSADASALGQVTLWLLLSFLPASGVFLRLGTLLAERLLYTPSGKNSLFLLVSLCLSATPFIVFYCILLSICIDRLTRKHKVLSLTVAMAIAAIFANLTIRRNPAWKNDDVLFLESVRVCPRSAKVR